MKPLVLYHANCPDGFTAAWCAHRGLAKQRHGDAELYPAEYGKEPPYDLARNRRVYVVDFSYPRAQLEQLYKIAGENGWAEFEGVHPLICLDLRRVKDREP